MKKDTSDTRESMENPEDMTGKGRGRGWLKLDKTQEPGGNAQNSSNSILETATSNYTLQVNPQYEKIAHAINQFSEGDDGILINRKFKYIIELLTTECRTQEDTESCFMYLYQKALHDFSFGTKFVAFITLNSFRELIICDVPLRRMLLTKMQDDFENAANIQKNDRTVFHNTIRIFGGFYEKATMAVCNKPYLLLSTPLVSYLEMLLDSAKPDDVELFGTQLYLNGAKIQEQQPKGTKAFVDILIKVRNLLISGNNLSEISKVWLLLAIDLGNSDFRMLSPDLLNYYQKKLGEKALLNIQKSLNQLSIQTLQASKTLENYSSDVNVLQVDTQPAAPKQQVNHINQQNQNHFHSNKKSPNFNSHKSKDDEMFSTWDTNEVNNQRKPMGKPGRPILGAGARNYNKDNWSDNSKENASGWDVKQKNTEGSGWGDKPHKRDGPREPRNNKGWEHDDRFETDY